MSFAEFKEEASYYLKRPEVAFWDFMLSPFVDLTFRICMGILAIFIVSIAAININTQWMLSNQRMERIEFLLDRQSFLESNK